MKTDWWKERLEPYEYDDIVFWCDRFLKVMALIFLITFISVIILKLM